MGAEGGGEWGCEKMFSGLELFSSATRACLIIRVFTKDLTEFTLVLAIFFQTRDGPIYVLQNISPPPPHLIKSNDRFITSVHLLRLISYE